jgi:uncharacterized membrane protein
MAAEYPILSGINIVLSLIVACLYGWILYYLVKLQQNKCLCALGWRWYSVTAFIGLTLLNLVAAIALDRNSAVTLLPAILQTAYVLFGLFNIYVIISYVQRLKKKSCKCSEGLAREVLQALAIVQLVVLIIAVIIAITMGHAIMQALKKAKKSKRSRS